MWHSGHNLVGRLTRGVVELTVGCALDDVIDPPLNCTDILDRYLSKLCDNMNFIVAVYLCLLWWPQRLLTDFMPHCHFVLSTSVLLPYYPKTSVLTRILQAKGKN